MKQPVLAGAVSRMAVLSVASFMANYGLFAMLVRGPILRPEVAAAAAMAFVLVMNFAACRYFVFRAASGNLINQALRFVAGTLVFRACEIATFAVLHRLTGWNSLLLYPATLAAFFVAKLLIYGRFVFHRSA